MNAPMLNIGASKETILAARQTILDILKTDNEQETKRTALTTLSSICSVNNTTVKDCTFTSKP